MVHRGVSHRTVPGRAMVGWIHGVAEVTLATNTGGRVGVRRGVTIS